MTDDTDRDDAAAIDDPTTPADTTTTDTAPADTTTADTASADTTPTDATPADTATTDTASVDDGPTNDNETINDGTIGRLSAGGTRGLLDRVGLGALVVFALVAGWSVYDQTREAIRLWVDPAFQPAVLAAFNLAVLLVALAGISHQLVRIRGE